MESSQLVSWQFEDFSTAELSPPTSPVSPSSPLFYNDGSNPSSPTTGPFKSHTSGATMVSQQSQKPVLSPVAMSSRAQKASNLLNELERLHTFDDQNAFGISMNEESVDLNMNLFEELADLEYTPPVTCSQEDNLKAFEVPTATLPLVVSPTNDKLSAEFKSIVESLSTGNSILPTSAVPVVPTITTTAAAVSTNNATSFNDLFQITGIPTTTVVGDECLIPVEFIGRPSSTTTGQCLGAEEAESMDLDGIIISNDMAIISENELISLGLEELSAELIAEDISVDQKNGMIPYWSKDLTVPLDELDTQMNKNDATLNALLQGNVSVAKSVILPPAPVVYHQAFSPISNADEDLQLEEAEVIEVIESVAAPAPKKTERRGRKPAKKDSLTYLKDKALRKKEQNKTAATRYRQKKKKELIVTLSEEEQLQQVHDTLEKEKDKVGSELRMIRSLLRDMLQARKKRPTTLTTAAATAATLSSSRLTASSLVQAQRIANRRK